MSSALTCSSALNSCGSIIASATVDNTDVRA
jgi:hypothetical protein